MKLIHEGQSVEFIDIDAERVPCSLLVKLTDRTYRMTFRYNEAGDFFTVDLELVSGGTSSPLVFGEILRYGKPLFEAFNDERYPLPVLCPMCLTGDEIEEISYDNFGSKVRLYLFDRPGGDG